MQGISYYHVLYPGYISLPERKAYLLNIDNKEVMIAVHNHIEALKIVDFDNSLLPEESGAFVLKYPLEKVSKNNINVIYEMEPANTTRQYVMEFEKHLPRTFATEFYTQLTIAYEISDINNITKKEEQFFEIAIREFLHSYRHISGDSRVRLYDDAANDRMVLKNSNVAYSEDDKQLPVQERLLKPRELILGLKSFTALKPRESVPNTKEAVKLNGKNLSSFVLEGNLVSDEFRLLAKAHEELDINLNAKFALLESFIVAELAISKALYGVKRKAGVSKKKLDEYETEVSISYMINVELPAFLDHITNQERQTLGEIDRIRKLRNEAMHKGKPVTQEQALLSINACSNLLYLLNNRGLLSLTEL
ncbi:MAG: hypothetical protein IPN42_02970 [Methylococcaceae bacterium]|nr:hypothetical protein [Methylococcaceae bacterium]